jgi:predicted O-methyltransferase YrrM
VIAIEYKKEIDKMKKLLIKEKLNELGIEIEEINMGLFDNIGEYTAKKSRDPNSNLYKSAGCFFRPNYERGILMYYMTKQYNFKSILEVGFGRGYTTFCIAKALCDFKIDGKVTTIDPVFSQDFLTQIFKIFPKEWFEKINFIQSTSEEFFKQHSGDFDLIYIDGDHRYDYVKKDWEYSKKIAKKYVIFDDYHLPTKTEKDIEVSKVVDNITNYKKELIIMDRRLFLDDRSLKDNEIDYGQVIVDMKTKE